MSGVLAGLYDDLFEVNEEFERPQTTEVVHMTPVEHTGQETSTTPKPSPPELSMPVRRPPQWIPAQATPRYTPPKQPDTSAKIKYFIMKSNNSTNIDRSLASGVWSTQHHNEAKLNNAFVEGYEVRLIFSINQSGHFQGYAKMKSAIGKGPKHNIWVGSAWGGFFEVDWQVQYDFPFSRFEHLTNPLNEGKPVKFARDGQEIPPDVGNEVVRIMQDIARANGLSKPVIANQLKVEPYPPQTFSEARYAPTDRRDRGRRGMGYRWGDDHGRYGGVYGDYSYGPPPHYSYDQRWHPQSAYGHAMPPTEYARSSYDWKQGPSGTTVHTPGSGIKRPRSPISAGEEPRKRSLYEMSYEEYLKCYNAVQNRIKEIMYSGELWKVLGMIPTGYVWDEEDQKRLEESGWLAAWFAHLAETSNEEDQEPLSEVENRVGGRMMTDTDDFDYFQHLGLCDGRVFADCC